MKKRTFFLVILSIVLLVAAIDAVVGVGVRWYVRHGNIPGDYGKIEYMLKHVDTQILLLGASTCMNSFEAKTMEKELGKTVFNGGMNDQRLEFYDVMSEAVFKRSPPELLILVLRNNDLTFPGNGRLAMMNIYYHSGNAKLDGYLNEGSLKRKILLSSALYRINTYWWRVLLYHFKSFDELANGGFVGKPVPKMLPKRWVIPSGGKTVTPANAQKMQCLYNILATCRKTGTCLWIVIPPMFFKFDDGADFAGISHIRDFCNQNNVPFIDDSHHPFFEEHPEYFYDNFHLNVDGAKVYTQLFLQELKKDYL